MPLIYDCFPEFFGYLNIKELGHTFIAFLFLKFTIIFSITFFFLIKKTQSLNLKFIILNFIFLLLLIFIVFFIGFLVFPSYKEFWEPLEEFKQEFLYENLFFFLVFYSLFAFIVLSSKYIYTKRNHKILRKLANSDYEKEKLFQFILNYEEPLFNFYKYRRLLEFTNSYIIEKNDEILGCINYINFHQFGILFDFYFEKKEYGEELLYFLKNNGILSNNFLICNFKETKILPLLETFSFVTQENHLKNLRNVFFNEIQYILEYSLKDFLTCLSDSNKNLVFLKNNALQEKFTI